MIKLGKNRVTIIGGFLAVVAILLLFSLIQCRHSKMSLTSIFCNPEKYHVDECLKFGDYNIGRQNQILTLPFYTAFMLQGKH